MFELIDTSDSEELRYPEELSGSWAYFTLFKDHPTLAGIACLHFNDKYPSGSMHISDRIMNDYPDMYGTWKKDDGTGTFVMDRALVSPLLRNRGIGRAGLSYGTKLLEYFMDTNAIHKYGSEIGNRLYTSAFGVDLVEDTPVEDALDLREDFFDQPIYPYVFFGRRVSR